MCGRFTFTFDDPDEIARILQAIPSAAFTAQHRPRFNVAPTDAHCVVRLDERNRPTIVPAKWGLGDKRPQINSRADNARTMTMLRDPAAGHRCLVPADGFLEWMGEKNNRRPIWFHRYDGRPVYFAGICAGTEVLKFSIVTTTPNDLVSHVHDRMPTIVQIEDARRFLLTTDHEEVRAFLRAPANDVLIGTEVNPRVNSVANDDPACLTPTTGDGQISLAWMDDSSEKNGK